MAIEAMISSLTSNALGKALGNAAQIVPQGQPTTSFKDVLSQADNGAGFANQLNMDLGGGLGQSGDLKVLSGEGVSYNPTDQVNAPKDSNASEKMLDMLGEVNKGQMQMDNLVNQVLYSGKKFSNQELLVIQASVFQWAQQTEMTVKVAEHTVSSVKAVLNTQV